jgi:hypothetical protein
MSIIARNTQKQHLIVGLVIASTISVYIYCRSEKKKQKRNESKNIDGQTTQADLQHDIKKSVRDLPNIDADKSKETATPSLFNIRNKTDCSRLHVEEQESKAKDFVKAASKEYLDSASFQLSIFDPGLHLLSVIFLVFSLTALSSVVGSLPYTIDW